MALHAIVTAGGTVESIDDVRMLQMASLTSRNPVYKLTQLQVENFSGGSFGHSIAEALQAQGVSTTLIGKQSLIKRLSTGNSLLRLVPFRSVQDLNQAIQEEIGRQKPDFFLMAAAVSDYAPVAVEGKISSSEEELVLRLRKNPKLLDALRGQVGQDCTLVGFKLVSGLSDEDLIQIALNQNMRANLDFTVGNDFQQIDFANGIHPMKVVDRDGTTVPFTGQRNHVASQLVSLLLERKLAS